MTIEGKYLDAQTKSLEEIFHVDSEGSWDGLLNERAGLNLTDSGAEGKHIGGTATVTSVDDLTVFGEIYGGISMERNEKMMSVSFNVAKGGIGAVRGRDWTLYLSHRSE